MGRVCGRGRYDLRLTRVWCYLTCEPERLAGFVDERLLSCHISHLKLNED